MDSDQWLSTTVDVDEPIRAYGSTATNSSAVGTNSNTNKNRNHEDIDIQLYDFKQQGVNFKDPLIPERQLPSSPVFSDEKKGGGKRPTSLLSSHSSDQHSAAYSETSFSQYESWVRHPRVRENWRIVLTSALLSLLGIGLLLTGLIIAISPSRGWHCLIFAFIGLLCVIPGGYHFVYIYCAALGRPGYHFEDLPVLR